MPLSAGAIQICRKCTGSLREWLYSLWATPVPALINWMSPGTIPEQPGVYRFRDATARVIYVGKARSLRQRLNSYFADPWTLHPRTAQMV